MRILLLSHRFAPLSVGGVERWTWTLAEALAAGGDEVQVLSRDDREERVLPPFSLVEGTPAGRPDARSPEGVGMHWITHRHSDARRATDAWRDPRFDAPLDALLDRLEPDVVHVAHGDGWGVAPFRRAARRGLVVGATLHDYKAFCARGQLLPEVGPPCSAAFEERCVRCVSDQLDRGPLQALAGRLAPAGLHERWARTRLPLEQRPEPPAKARRRWRARQRALMEALNGCDVLTAPSEFVARAHRQAGLRRGVDVLRNPTPGAPPPISPRRPGPLRVGFFGTDVPSKGLGGLLRAAAGVSGVEVHVHGPRPGAPGERLVWHGPYEPEQAAKLMSGVDVIALPSVWPENAPLVAEEARLAGRPRLVSAVGGLPEGVRDGVDGWILPADDVAAWADRLRALAAEPAEVVRATAAVLPPGSPQASAADHRRLWQKAIDGR